MQLRPENVTIASRVLLPAFPALSATFGANLLITSGDELAQTPLYVGMSNVVALEWWAAAFLVLAAALVYALVTHTRKGYELALASLMLWLAVVTCVFVVIALRTDATLGAAIWPAFSAIVCWSALLSLQAGER